MVNNSQEKTDDTKSILIFYTQPTHDDFELVLAELKARNVKTLLFNIQPLLENSLSWTDFINSWNWEEIQLIELRYCRGIPRRWSKGYQPIFENLRQFIDLQKNQGNPISVTPSFETLNWVLDKANYTRELQKKEIPTIPTCVINFQAKNQFNFADYLKQNGLEHVVLKPALGSGADGIEFIRLIAPDYEQSEVKVCIRESDNVGTQNLIVLENSQQLNTHFQNYCLSYDVPILIQNFEPIKREISVIFINDNLHFVERTVGLNTGIAHEKFGGENIWIQNPAISWKNFALNVYQNLPDAVKNTASIRIDIFELTDGKLILSEIEGASHRTLFPETLNYYKKHPTAEKQKIYPSDLQGISPLKNYIKKLCSYLESDQQK